MVMVIIIMLTEEFLQPFEEARIDLVILAKRVIIISICSVCANERVSLSKL